MNLNSNDPHTLTKSFKLELWNLVYFYFGKHNKNRTLVY